jgi:hypothetical protein
VGDDAMVIITEPADRPSATGVWSSRRFHLHGPLPGEMGARLFGHHPGSHSGAGASRGMCDRFICSSGQRATAFTWARASLAMVATTTSS